MRDGVESEVESSETVGCPPRPQISFYVFFALKLCLLVHFYVQDFKTWRPAFIKNEDRPTEHYAPLILTCPSIVRL